MAVAYTSVYDTNQGIFGNPRQKRWAVLQNTTGWQIQTITNNFDSAKDTFKQIINKGGIFSGIDKLMLVEIVPIDTIITP